MAAPAYNPACGRRAEIGGLGAGASMGYIERP